MKDPENEYTRANSNRGPLFDSSGLNAAESHKSRQSLVYSLVESVQVFKWILVIAGIAAYMYVGVYLILICGAWFRSLAGALAGLLIYTSPASGYVISREIRQLKDLKKPTGWISAAEKELAKNKRI